MATTPTPRSYNAVLGGMIDAFLSKYGLKSLKVGSPVLSILEAAAQSDVRSSQDIFDLLNSISLDRASGTALDRIGADEDLPRITESAASGPVTITDSRYQKISTKVFQGKPAPIVGTVNLYVADASDFPASGQLYLGRGTPNYEGPLSYSSKINNTTYWTIVLSDTTKKFHNLGESVILAQGGNRVIGAGAVVQTPQGNTSDAIQFSTLYAATIADGEVSVDGVIVVAKKPGIIGNVTKEAINSFASVPFTGATVINPGPFSNGQASESDIDYRDRIRNARASRVRGTSLALKTSVLGITSTDEHKRVTSASIVNRQGYPSTLYIDDGTGYEERSEGVAIEPLNSSSLGGEQYFQLSLGRPVTKAFVETSIQAPFVLASGDQLAVKVGGILYTHLFDISEFRNIGNASAYEVVASINGNSAIAFSARTSSGGTRVVIFAKEDTNEDIEVVSPSSGPDANNGLIFPSGRVDTLRLYKNDRFLSKDGSPAVLKGEPLSTWDSLSSPETLEIAVDGTPAVVYTFTDQDFIDADTGYSTLASNSLSAWAAVLNARIPGITASALIDSLAIQSNLGNTSRARIAVSGGTLVAKNVFPLETAVGADLDYTLDRNTGQGRLEVPLAAGDRLSAGTINTRAFLESEDIPATTLGAAAKLWFDVDGNAEIIQTGIGPSQTFLRGTYALENFGHRFRITASSGTPFTNAQAGDFAIFWDSTVPAGLQGLWRIVRSGATFIEIERRDMLGARYGHQAVRLNDGRVLAVGGSSGEVVLRACEVYDPATKLWEPAASMASARKDFLALLLSDGKVLVAGGKDENGALLNSCEIYDPTGDFWSAASTLPAASAFLEGCQIGGKVFVCGGETLGGMTANAYWASYGGSLGAWTATASPMAAARGMHTVTPLNDGINVLIAGGVGSTATNAAALNSAELWNSSLDTFTTTGAPGETRYGHQAFKLTDGRVMLVDGSEGSSSIPRLTCRIFDPSSVATTPWLAGIVLPESHLTWSGTWGIRSKVSGALLTTANVIVLLGGSSPAAYGHRFPNLAAGAVTALNSTYINAGANGNVIRTGAVGVALSGTELMFVAGEFSPSTDATKRSPGALADRYHESTGFGDPDPDASAVAFSFSSNGLQIARTSKQVREESVPAGTNYTADGFSEELSIPGATVGTYRTNRLRVNTNSFDEAGSIRLLTTNLEGQGLLLPLDLETNIATHLGSVESLVSTFGTPDFSVTQVGFAKQADSLVAIGASDFSAVPATVPWVSPNKIVVGVKNPRTPVNSSYQLPQPSELPSTILSSIPDRLGVNRSFWSALKNVDAETDLSSLLVLRDSPSQGWQPHDRFYLASPYAVGSNDSLVVVADGDAETKRFAVNMHRTLKPNSSTYATTNVFKDGDNGNVTLATAFGLDYPFEDFTVYMRARGKTHDSDNTKRVLWRYKRYGIEGNRARVRYVYPAAPSLAVDVSSDNLNSNSPDYTNISIALPSGARKTPPGIRTTTKLGYAAYKGAGPLEKITICSGLSVSSAVHTLTDATLTLAFPSVDVNNHGLVVGNQIWLQSTDANFPTGLKTISGVTANTITYLEAGVVAVGGALGDISFDVVEAYFDSATPSAIAVGDILHLEDWSAIPSQYRNQTIRVQAVGRQYIQGYAETFVSPETQTLSWQTILDPLKLVFYPLNTGSCTATAIAAAVNALDDSCPVNATVIGTGAGTILLSTEEELLVDDSWIPLTDGINWVKISNSPVLITGDYSFDFKAPIDASLVSNSDWANEVVRLAPTTGANVVDWLNAPAVTGLFTACSAQLSDSGAKVQISSLTPGSAGGVEVQGGSSSALSFPVVGSASTDTGISRCMVSAASSDIEGLHAGMWVAINNSSPLPKAGVFQAATALASIAITGANESTITLSAGAVYSEQAPGSTVNNLVQVEKQGNFVAIVGAIDVALSTATEGSWVRITGGTSPSANDLNAVNQGIYRVVRIAGNTVWIENPNAIEESGKIGSFYYYTSTSLMPGDVVSISSDVWGSGNRGQWVVTSVGNNFTSALTFKVAGLMSPKGVVAALGASEAQKFTAIEAQPARLIKRVHAIAPNQADATLVDIKFDTALLADRIGAAGGSIITVLDKLSFPTGVSSGVDGYRYSTGLIGEATRVVYGDDRDNATYPGVIAAGATVNIQGPIVKRITIGLQIRSKLGISTVDIADKVKSAVASAVNQVGVGEPISISDIVNAASSINGVQAVAVVSPIYSVGNDLISVQPYEKPLVLNVDQDVLVSFVGE